jgi:hypothetical protein
LLIGTEHGDGIAHIRAHLLAHLLQLGRRWTSGTTRSTPSRRITGLRPIRGPRRVHARCERLATRFRAA